MSKSRVYLCLLILGVAFWGVSFSFAKEAFEKYNINPFVFLGYRFFIALVVLSVIFFRRLKNLDSNTIKCGVITAIPLILATSLQTGGLKFTSITNTGFITGLDVLFVPILKWVFFKGHVKPKVWIACIIAIIGLYIVAAGESGLQALNKGDIAMFFSAIMFALYVLFVSKYGKRVKDRILFVMVQMFVCSFLWFSYSFATLEVREVIPEFKWDIWKLFLFPALFATAYMYTMQSVAQKYLGEEQIAMTYILEPIFAALGAYFLMNERVTIYLLIGGLLILFSMFITEYNFSKRKKINLKNT